MGQCSVPNCRGSYHNGPKDRVFSVPKDDRRVKWERAVCRDDIPSIRDPKGLGLSPYWAIVKAENAVLFVYIGGQDPPVVERSVIVSRNMKITAFWKKVKEPAKVLLIPATVDDLRSLRIIIDHMSSFKAPDVCDKEEKVKATFSLLFSLLDDLRSGDLLLQEKTEALDFIKERLDLLHRKDRSLQ
ncbi:hypothetical protein HPB51_011459 [Rhipicephalus microplus]|uniref:Uncharacterized protein n=1 Tax=Rhipicephalus microplus TaxID=6941 RepID=A0A9J6DU91_RHIMP|nr:hypothetical protein HPB51_011459 [Rhipicephalus microplus]